ncbi:MAG: transposase [Bacteroidales bacterium]|nr:transposase [Bacteroidales bacterium]
MKINALQNRRSIRLQGYDYSQAGVYFMTICTQNRACLFGDIVDGEMRLNDVGRMIQTVWDEMPRRDVYIDLDTFIVMPNHIHGILIFHGRGESCIRPGPESSVDHRAGDHRVDGDHAGDHKDRPYGTLPGTVGRIVQAFKSITTHEYIQGVKQNGWTSFCGKLWQRNYWEHIVRNETELIRIREYIRNNPAQWELDKLHPSPMCGRPAGRPNQIREPITEYGG